jgi:hypothetical protein
MKGIMFRFTALALFATLAFAQKPPAEAEKPPAAVDAALRARIDEFYHYFQVQEFRKAEKLVAEDSKDFFYDHNKPHYLSTTVQSIQYSGHFTRADVIALCEQYVMMPGFAGKPMKVPTASTWKVVDGQWFWYVDQSGGWKTPFGVVRQRPDAPPPAAGALPASIPTTADFAMHLVKPEKDAVTLKAGESVRIAITNTAKGIMTVAVAGMPPGIAAKLDRATLNAGEKAELTVTVAAGARAGKVLVQVQPTQELIPIAVTVR